MLGHPIRYRQPFNSGAMIGGFVAQPISSQNLGEASRQLMIASMQNRVPLEDYYDPAVLPSVLDAVAIDNAEARHRILSAREMDLNNQGQFLNTLGQLTAGRGVNKANETPAERQGIFAKNQKLFGIEPKNPIPYQSIIGNQQNLAAMLNGFAAKADIGSNENVGALIQNLLLKSNLIGEAFDVKKTESIYANVPKEPAINLYNIQLRNQRRDNLFSIV